MLKRLQDKWGVSGLQFGLILLTFAIGGSLCARLGSYALGLIFSEKGLAYWLLYIPMMTVLWPACVILVSIPLGQFKFFKSYIVKIGQKLGWLK
jgi:hypothetical protein